MQLKSQIARPRVYEVLAPGQPYTVCGAAWAGETTVTEIAVSTDGGKPGRKPNGWTWSRAMRGGAGSLRGARRSGRASAPY